MVLKSFELCRKSRHQPGPAFDLDSVLDIDFELQWLCSDSSSVFQQPAVYDYKIESSTRFAWVPYIAGHYKMFSLDPVIFLFSTFLHSYVGGTLGWHFDFQRFVIFYT